MAFVKCMYNTLILGVHSTIKEAYLEWTADCTVDEEIDGRVDHHQHPSDEVHLVEVNRRDVLTSGNSRSKLFY